MKLTNSLKISYRRVTKSRFRREAKGEGELVALPQSPRARLVVTEPESFDDIPVILDHLKKRRPVIVRLSDHRQGTGTAVSWTLPRCYIRT